MILRKGDKNTDVLAWQQFLNTQNYQLTADRKFGEKTANATRFFQAKHGLRGDGIVGKETLKIARELGFDYVPKPEVATEETSTISSVTVITSELLAAIFPDTKRSLRDRWINAFNEFLPKYEITTNLRVAAFLATGGVETDYLRVTAEYASGKAYEGRKDLGNTQPGDGVKFKGHGFFQTTGRYNHNQVTKATFARLGIDFVKEPKRLTEIPIAVESACIFWEQNDCAEYADKGDFFGVSGIVNRGSAKKKALHYDKRLALYELALEHLPKKLF